MKESGGGGGDVARAIGKPAATAWLSFSIGQIIAVFPTIQEG